MLSKEFVQEMQDALYKQTEQKEHAEKVKLHDAKIRATEGSKNWAQLKTEIANMVQAISSDHCELEYTSPNDNAVYITNRIVGRTITVTFDPNSGGFSFSGPLSGIFTAQVHGNFLQYALTGVSPTGQVAALQQKIGSDPKLWQIAELLVRAAVRD